MSENALHILVVDDEKTIRELLKQLLELNGYSVIAASNGREALAIYEKDSRHIDLVITDLGLPNMDGLELGSQLKTINSEVKMICITGFVSPDKKQELFEAGFKEIINKPFDIRWVTERVKSILGY